MDDRLPLPALLSHALVAFTIEFDNEFEQQMPHRTTNHGGLAHTPWLVSMVMWSNFMQFIPEDGIPARELQRLLRKTSKSMQAWLTRMGKWWGYIVVDAGAVVRPTSGGLKAQAVWRPLAASIENRWQERFGVKEINHLRESLWTVASQLSVELPDGLPILGYGLFSREPDQGYPASAEPEPGGGAPISSLPALLSKVLLAFAIDFESNSELSLAISANLLRLPGKEGVRVRDLPRLAGVSKEAIAMSQSFLKKRGYAVEEPEAPGSRVKVLVLTEKGQHGQNAYCHLVWTIEERWQARFGSEAIRNLREVLERLVGEPTAQSSPLFRGLNPYPNGWRASVPSAERLPHYPMVLHRGGFPDGS
jgi:DNA-binding MarR family transcriptional regulator